MYHTYMNEVCLEFDWDEGNIEKNLKKHSISCEEAEEVFFDKDILFNTDVKHSQQEERIIALGKTALDILLFVVFTRRGKTIRIISARRANTKERCIYESTT